MELEELGENETVGGHFLPTKLEVASRYFLLLTTQCPCKSRLQASLSGIICVRQQLCKRNFISQSWLVTDGRTEPTKAPQKHISPHTVLNSNREQKDTLDTTSQSVSQSSKQQQKVGVLLLFFPCCGGRSWSWLSFYHSGDTRTAPSRFLVTIGRDSLFVYCADLSKKQRSSSKECGGSALRT